MTVLDGLAVAFGHTLRAHGLPASPAEVIEIRRVMDIVGAADLDRLRTGQYPGLLAEPLPPPFLHRAGGSRPGVELPEPSLAGQAGHPGEQLGLVLDHQPRFHRDIDHAVVAGDHQPDVLRQCGPQLARQLIAPGERGQPGR